MQASEFIYAYYFNHDSTAEKIANLHQFDGSRPHWLHFDYTLEQTKIWLEQQHELDPVVVDALLNEETRPRATPVNDGMLIALRGVNLAPNSNPEDMVSVRLWLTKDRVISTRHRRLLSMADIDNELASGQGPATPTQLVVELTDRLISRMNHTIENIEDKVFAIEENVLASKSYALRNDIAGIRRQIIALRRYLAPQKEAMMQLMNERLGLFSTNEKIQLRETTDQLTRLIEDLDSLRDRAAVTQEELSSHLAEQMNNRMYMLSIVAAIFLPLGFLTGLLGVNVGGIPGADNGYAFALFNLLLVLIISLQVWIFKKNNWF